MTSVALGLGTLGLAERLAQRQSVLPAGRMP
jgi:hypothetical protein